MVVFMLVEVFGLLSYFFILWRRKEACFNLFKLCHSSGNGSGNYNLHNTTWTKKVCNNFQVYYFYVHLFPTAKHILIPFNNAQKTIITHTGIIILIILAFCFVTNMKFRNIILNNKADKNKIEEEKHWSAIILNYGKLLANFLLGYYTAIILTSFTMIPVVSAFIFQHISYEFEEVLKANEADENLVIIEITLFEMHTKVHNLL